MPTPPSKPKRHSAPKSSKSSKAAASFGGATSSPYHPAAAMLNEMWKRHVSLKTLAFGSSSPAKGNLPTNKGRGGGEGEGDLVPSTVGSMACSKTTYAQASNVLRFKHELDTIFERHREQLEGAANRGLLYVLLYELLEGPNRAIKGGGSVKRMLVKVEADLRRDWDDLLSERRKRNATDGEGRDDDDGASVALVHPRYVRVNTLLATKASMVERLDDLNIPWKDDDHVPDLLVVPSRDADTTCKLVELAPRVILQDKSSCLPALCLVHGYGTPLGEGDCIDACAAPGNKTLHLAALLASASSASNNNDTKDARTQTTTANTTVHAFDKDSRRCRDLKRRVDEHTKGAAFVRVKVECNDFLSLQPNDYPKVKAILLDPTCSGSGTVAGMERRGGNVDDNEAGNDDVDRRIQSLSRFQCAALLHAMSFPNCHWIVYSTCSIYDAENEEVVADALRHEPTHEEWMVVPPRCLSGWTRRGRQVAGLTQEQASALIRVDPHVDDTGGFFVACFERQRTPECASNSVAADTTSKGKKKRSSNPPGPDSLLAAPVTKRPKGRRESDAEGTVDVAATAEDTHKLKGAHSSSSTDRSSRMVAAKTGEATCKKRLKKLQWKQRQREEKQRRLQDPKAT